MSYDECVSRVAPPIMNVLAPRAKPLNLPLNLNVYKIDYPYRPTAARSIVHHSKPGTLGGHEYPHSKACRFKKQVLSIVELPILIGANRALSLSMIISAIVP